MGDRNDYQVEPITAGLLNVLKAIINRPDLYKEISYSDVAYLVESPDEDMVGYY